MLECPSCGQLTEEGKFCTNCGAPLSADEEAAAAGESEQPQTSSTQPTLQEDEQEQTEQPPNEVVEKIKEIGNDFGNFFLTLVKKPSAAKQSNENDWISSVITIAAYAIMFAVGYFFALKSAFGTVGDLLGDELFGVDEMMDGMMESFTSVTFTGEMLWPFLKIVIVLAVVIAVSFVGLKLATNNIHFLGTLSTYGAYLMPFTLLLILGYLMFFVKLQTAGLFVIFISLLAAVLVIPTILLLEAKSAGIDKIYVMIIAHAINLFLFAYLIAKLFIPVFVTVGLDSFIPDVPGMGF